MGSSESHSILLTDVKEMRKHSKQRNRNCGMKAEGGFILHYLRPHFRSVALLSNLHLRQELGGPPKVKKLCCLHIQQGRKRQLFTTIHATLEEPLE